MNNQFTAKAATTIHAPVSKVWQALVNPEIIKQYLFNTEVISDCKVGSPILYRGEWEGKPFEDKGEILAIEPEKILKSSHWSPLSGVPDSPENYHTVTYTLKPGGWRRSDNYSGQQCQRRGKGPLREELGNGAQWHEKTS